MGLFPQFQRRLLIPRRQRKKKDEKALDIAAHECRKQRRIFRISSSFVLSLSSLFERAFWNTVFIHLVGFPFVIIPTQSEDSKSPVLFSCFVKRGTLWNMRDKKRRSKKWLLLLLFLSPFPPTITLAFAYAASTRYTRDALTHPQKMEMELFSLSPIQEITTKKKKREKEQEHTSLPCSSQSSADCSSHCAEVRSVVFVTLTMKRHHSIILLQASSFSVFFFFFFESSKRSTREKKVQLTPNQQTKKRTGIIFRRKTQKMEESG